MDKVKLLSEITELVLKSQYISAEKSNALLGVLVKNLLGSEPVPLHKDFAHDLLDVCIDSNLDLFVNVLKACMLHCSTENNDNHEVIETISQDPKVSEVDVEMSEPEIVVLPIDWRETDFTNESLKLPLLSSHGDHKPLASSTIDNYRRDIPKFLSSTLYRSNFYKERYDVLEREWFMPDPNPATKLQTTIKHRINVLSALKCIIRSRKNDVEFINTYFGNNTDFETFSKQVNALFKNLAGFNQELNEKDDQEMSEDELKRIIFWPNLVEMVKSYINENIIGQNMDEIDIDTLRAAAFTSLCVIDNAPRRNDIVILQRCYYPHDNDKQNWFDTREDKITLRNYKTFLTYGDYIFKVTSTTKTIIENLIKRLPEDQKFLFIRNDQALQNTNYTNFYTYYFDKIGAKSQTCKLLRVSCISYKKRFGEAVYARESQELARQMGHTVYLQNTVYLRRVEQYLAIKDREAEHATKEQDQEPPSKRQKSQVKFTSEAVANIEHAISQVYKEGKELSFDELWKYLTSQGYDWLRVHNLQQVKIKCFNEKKKRLRSPDKYSLGWFGVVKLTPSHLDEVLAERERIVVPEDFATVAN